MSSAPSAGRRFSPLDEELELLPGMLPPSLQEYLTRLGTKMPFPQAQEEVRLVFHIDVSEPTIRRTVEGMGAAYVTLQTEDVARLERETPLPPVGPPLQQLSVDGAMVPLLAKEWGEVRTLALGVVAAPVERAGEQEVHTGQVSYFSRLCDAETFTRLALVETHRRGTERAGTVCAVVDGAEWAQGFIDMHRPDAVRILDFGHAAEYVAAAGQAAFGQGTEEGKAWLADTLHTLKHGAVDQVLAEMTRQWERVCADGGAGTPELDVIAGSLRYMGKRREQMAYATFQGKGYPIGSGMVESANKLVVEARLKGAGMHWARSHVNPLLALRTAVCSGRWEEVWPHIYRRRRQAVAQRCQEERERRRAVRSAPLPAALPGEAHDRPAVASGTDCPVPEQTPSRPCKPPTQRLPGPEHPWKRISISPERARSLPPTVRPKA